MEEKEIRQEMTNKINWKMAIIAGILGTILFDVVGLIITGNWWDIPSLLGAKTGLGFAYGIAGHFSNGILLAILYAGISTSLWGPNWFKALLFVSVQTVALVWLFMLPLLGAGVAGLDMDPLMPLITLVRHWAYAIPLIFLINQVTDQSKVTLEKI